MNFIDSLDRHRQELGMSHRAFARYLGMKSHATWVLARTGQKPVGPAFVGRVLLNRPELRRFLDDDATTAAA